MAPRRRAAGRVGRAVGAALAGLVCAACVARAPSAETPDAHPPSDATPDVAPLAPADSGLAPDMAPALDRCPASCDRVAACAIEGCAALTADDEAALIDTCLDRCAALPSIGPVVAGLSDCDAIRGFTEQAIPGVLDPCVYDPAFPPAEPLCRIYGERIAECLAPICPPAAAHRAALAAGFTHECDVAVADGADPSGVQAIADAPCDAWRDAVAQRAQADLAAFCARGPLDDPAACAAACATAAECLDPDAAANAPFRNPERCTMLCIASTDAPPGWACLAERMTCDAIEPCFAPRGPEPACRVEAERVAACVAAVCAPIEPLRAGFERLMIAGCDAALGNRSRTLAEVEAVVAAEDCADGALAERVALVIDRPMDPANALTPICAEGPRDPALCGPACAALAPCLDPSNALTDGDVCAFYCGTTATYDDAAWRCAGEAAGCEATVQCFAEGN